MPEDVAVLKEAVFGFNPRPALRPGDASSSWRSDMPITVSIRARP